MKRKLVRLISGLVLCGVVAVTASCALDEGPTGVDTAPAVPGGEAPDLLLGGLLGPLVRPLGLLQCSPLRGDTESKTIGPQGGYLQIGPHLLVVPRGALDRYVTITATIPSNSRTNRVQFQPRGLRFDESAYLTMSCANCDLLGRLLPKRIAYVDGNLNILYYLLSLDILQFRVVTGKVDHFSQYALAW
jgi:hypothetical protein